MLSSSPSELMMVVGILVVLLIFGAVVFFGTRIIYKALRDAQRPPDDEPPA